MNETGLIRREKGTFYKIRKFLKNLFKRKAEVIEYTEEIAKKDNEDFKKNIQIKENKEKIRLLKLQEEFAKGNIQEENISEEDVEKLYELYDEQIEEINKKTEMYKQKILDIKAKINKNA